MLAMRKTSWTIEKLRRHVTVLAGAHAFAIDWLALVLIDAVEPFRISGLFVKLFRLAVLVADRFALLVQDRKDDGVATSAQR